jgi:hypothetical protein
LLTYELLGDAPANGLSFSRTSSMLGDCKTCAIEGGRERFKLLAYALLATADAVDEVEDEDRRCKLREARRSSFSLFFSACRIKAATAGSRRLRADEGVSGIAERLDETVLAAERPGLDSEDEDEAAEEDNDDTDDRLSK